MLLDLGLRNKLDCIWAPTPLVARAEECLEARGFRQRPEVCQSSGPVPPRLLDYILRSAQVFEARGEFAESVRDYTKVDSLGYYDGLADRYDTLADRGRVYEKMGVFDKAAASYCEALRGGRNSNRSSIVRGVALHRVKGPGEYDSDRHPDALSSLLKFINEAIAARAR